TGSPTLRPPVGGLLAARWRPVSGLPEAVRRQHHRMPGGSMTNPSVTSELDRRDHRRLPQQLATTRTTFMKHNVALFGPKTLIPASRTIAGRIAGPGKPSPKSTVVTAGEEAPDGFGKQVLWHPDDAALAAVVFLNAGDYPRGML